MNPLAGSGVIEKNGNYYFAHGDSDELRLYDFTTNTSFRILFIGMYGPLIDGIAWLTDELLAAGGEHFDLSGETDKVAPAVMVFDLNKMTMRTLVGKFINTLDYFKTRRLGEKPLTEPRLMFQFRRKNYNLKQK